MRNEQDVIRAMEQYADTVRRLCMIHLKSYHDSEDIFQNVFLKYVLSSVKFESEEHEKAWFIRVTINACRDFFRDFFRSHMVPLEELIHQQEELTPDNSEVLEAVLSLPEKYREAVYLYYYEGYTAVEIAHILKKNKNTVYTLLTRSKQLLRERLGGDDCET
ncbi:MAG: sigma-70 family RNA polymerase sigma factor [Dorea sp.]|jgi:RNA polymerase sigma factor (sigma-70 family)|nr:sigma-70 family RNA polymerase sigma factor [Dorea sp.]